MNNELAVVTGRNALPDGMPQIDVQAIERVLLQGDLAQLKPTERVAYYNSLCRSLSLNILTKPFEYISLNGKLTLYATKNCTDQLRHIYNISISVMKRETTEGCYVVTTQAKMPSGRADEDIGAVSIENLKGEARSNAMMKAHTKSKRRVTLSICGLSFMDETEIDSVRGAYHIPVSHETGEMPELAPAPTLAEDIQQNPPAAQRKQIPFDVLKYFGDIKGRFKKVGSEPIYYEVLKRHGVSHANEFINTDDARGCYKELQLTVQDLEAASIDASNPQPPKGLRNREEWPDDPEASALGLWIKIQGQVYYRTQAEGPWRKHA